MLHPVVPTSGPSTPDATQLRDAVRHKDVRAAEQTFARIAQGPAEDAFNELLWTVQDETEVHRVVLPYRAWDLLGLIGKDHAHALLRQSVRYCVKAESWPRQTFLGRTPLSAPQAPGKLISLTTGPLVTAARTTIGSTQ